MSQPISLRDIKIVIFDMDGVILDIVGSVQKATIDAVKKYKEIYKTPEEILEELAHLIEKIQTIPIPKIILQSKELLDVTFVKNTTVLKRLEIGAYIYSTFNKYKQNEASIYDGIGELIKFLSNKGKKLAVLTNNKKSNAIETLNKYNLDQYFDQDLILGYNEVKNIKPDPEGLFKILELAGVKNLNKVIFIGDMTSDIQAGNLSKIKTVCVVSGLSKKEDLIKENPYTIVDNTYELCDIFGLSIK